MSSPLRSWLSALLFALAVTAAEASPPTVRITGQVFDAQGLAAAGTRVTFKTVGIQTLSDTDKTVISPTTFTSLVQGSGTMTPIDIPKGLVVEVQVGRAQPRTIYTGTVDTTLGALLATYNPEIPIGQGSGGGTTIVSGGETWTSFATETKIAPGITVYVSPGGMVTDQFSDAVFPAGAASWSNLSCVLGGSSTMGVTATLLAGACNTETASTQSVSSVSSTSVTSTGGGAANTTASQCVALKIVTTGTGNASYINCAVKRTAS